MFKKDGVLDPDSTAFFEKYRFSATSLKKHPIYGDMMEFKGLEADYVSRLESDVEHYKKLSAQLMNNNESLISRESYRLRDEITKLKAQKEETK